MTTNKQKSPPKEPPREQTVAGNRRVYHDYFVDETIEAGLVLTGTEVKSVRAGHVNLREAYARVENREVWLYNAHISPYSHGNRYNHEPNRPRKLLLHRNEIMRLKQTVQKKGVTLVPVRIYFKRNHAKVELGLGRGKKLYDKRDSIAERDAKREIERALRSRSSGRDDY
ncbi:MAG TPA: SsrA-binding protein SmpB [Chloroflexota bacterium]|nr:SsrA-binding protein SmpB [Chloroflexota bacterium]